MLNILLFLNFNIAQTCKIQTDKGTFDLSKISGLSYHVVDTITSYVSYDFSFCSNIANISDCRSSPGSVSGVQHANIYGQCYKLGTWDQSYVSSGIASTDNGFQITFENGDSELCIDKNHQSMNRILVYDFECSGDDVGTLTLAEPANCEYEVTVPTKYACPGGVPSKAAGLSGGSIFLIILVVLIPVYCIAGIAYNRKQAGKEGFKNCIPHGTLWCNRLPYWTKTGCFVSWKFFVSTFRLCQKKFCGKDIRENEDGDGDYEEVE